MADKWVLVIGAGFWQIPLINTVKRLGFRALAIDRDTSAPGGEIADKFLPIDITDHVSAVRIAHEYRVIGAVSDQTDLSVPTLAKVCDSLKLPGPRPETAYNTTNKARMRQLVNKAGLKNPRFRICVNADDGIRAITDNHPTAPDGVGFPCVVKPTDSQASRGVQKVDSMENMKDACEEALKFSREKKILVEQFLRGTEVTVEGCRYAGETHLLCTSTKKHTPPPHIIAINLDFPAQLPDEKISEIENTYFKLVSTLGITAGSIHGELIVTDDGVYLVEMANRGGGSGTSSHCIPAYSGVDILEANVRYATGDECAVKRTKNRSGVLRFLLFPPGKVTGIDGVEAARKIDGVVACDLYIRTGDVLIPPTMDTMRHGYAITVGDTIEQARMSADTVEKTIKVTVK